MDVHCRVWLYLDARDPNAGFHARVVSTAPTGLSALPLVSFDSSGL